MNTNKLLHFFLCLISTIIITQSNADIINANNAYHDENYENAFTQYRELAELGNPQAQYNLAVMHYKGQGTSKNLVKAYAWAQLIDYDANPDLSNLAEVLNKELSVDNKVLALDFAESLRSTYSTDVINQLLAPIPVTNNQSHKRPSTDFSLKIISSKPPRYPVAQLRKNIQGWVRVGFEVYPDGSVRNPYVIESVPPNVFDEATLNAITDFKFEVKFKDGVEPHPISTRQMIQYQLAVKNTEKLTEIYQQHVSQLQQLAHDNHPDAQYYYALAASSASPLNEQVKLTDVDVNGWLFKAAQNGNLKAQYLLGQNLLAGKGCVADTAKGIRWFIHAANKEHAKSSRKVFQLFSQNPKLNNTQHPAEYWLIKAAENGDPESQLEYAHFIVSHSEHTELIPKAEEYLALYLKNRDKSVKYHQVLAQLYLLKSNDKKAQKELNKAHKLAQKLGWEI